MQAAWPDLVCYGCGRANDHGLHLESDVTEEGDTLIATVEPSLRFVVVPGIVYGGYLASVIDCNSMWLR